MWHKATGGGCVLSWGEGPCDSLQWLVPKDVPPHVDVANLLLSC